MKNLLILLAFILFSAHAFSSVVETCRNSQFLSGTDDLPHWEPINFSIVVNKTNTRYSAVIMVDGKEMPTEKQIKVTDFVTGNELARLKYILNMAKIPAAKTATMATIYNLHPFANAEDSNGVTLNVLYDSRGFIVGKVFSLGWGIGICK